jgi:hypothetical protein
MLPESISIPTEFSCQDILALFVAALTWQRHLLLKFDQANAAALLAAKALLKPLLETFTAAVELREDEACFKPWNSEAVIFPEVVKPLLAPEWSALLLSIPVFAGGRVTLAGRWMEQLAAPSCLDLLRQAGLKVELLPDGISATQVALAPPTGGVCFRELLPCLHPLFWAINGRIAFKNQQALFLEEYPQGADLKAAADFLAQIGLNLESQEKGVALAPLNPEGSPAPAAKSYGWTSPAPEWAVAFSLLAFLKANLKITNPDSATEAIPDYWELYNSLPEPKAPSSAPGPNAEKTAVAGRRRIMTEEEADPSPQ